jgi:hypothetical protein
MRLIRDADDFFAVVGLACAAVVGEETSLPPHELMARSAAIDELTTRNRTTAATLEATEKRGRTDISQSCGGTPKRPGIAPSPGDLEDRRGSLEGRYKYGKGRHCHHPTLAPLSALPRFILPALGFFRTPKALRLPLAALD